MRITLNISEDVLSVAKDLARREKKTVGEVISTLARRALTAQSATTRARAPAATYGLRPFATRGGIVTNELINELREGDVY
jgi:hypothetical protein